MPPISYGLGFGSPNTDMGVIRPGTRGHAAMYGAKDAFDIVSPMHGRHGGAAAAPLSEEEMMALHAKLQRSERYMDEAFDGRQTFLQVTAGGVLQRLHL
jgi:hypothetical protein